MTQPIKKWFASNDHQTTIHCICPQQWWGKFNSRSYFDYLSFKNVADHLWSLFNERLLKLILFEVFNQLLFERATTKVHADWSSELYILYGYPREMHNYAQNGRGVVRYS